MGKKTQKNTKSKIVSAAWKLFYEQGYDATTVDDILLESGTSKGSFYHYFEGKDALLGSLAYLFDEKYEQLSAEISPDTNSIDVLAFLNRELFEMIENRIDIDLLIKLYSTQLTTKGEKHLLDRSRTYFKLLNQVIRGGQERGELRDDMTVNEIVKAYAMFERALMYDWCLSGGEYALSKYADQMIPIFLSGFKK